MYDGQLVQTQSLNPVDALFVIGGVELSTLLSRPFPSESDEMRKFESLTTCLNRVRSDEREVILTFEEIERVCGEPLPKNAWHQDFWGNPSNRPYVQGIKKAIRAAGFCAALSLAKAGTLHPPLIAVMKGNLLIEPT